MCLGHALHPMATNKHMKDQKKRMGKVKVRVLVKPPASMHVQCARMGGREGQYELTAQTGCFLSKDEL